MIRIILASKSPRRKEILERIGFFLEIMPSKADEIFYDNEPPETAVVRIAREKALAVQRNIKNCADCLIIGADTVVYLGGKIIGQPQNREEAKKMLRLLQGNVHTVYTGVCLIKNGKEYAEGFSKSEVEFHPMNEKEIEWYLSSNEPMDKAGAYGVQGKGAFFIKKINGSFHNVMGFPVDIFYKLLKELEVDISKII